MSISLKTFWTKAGTVILLLPLVACGFDTATSGKDVDVYTPAGSLSVRTDVEQVETGLPTYPGAVPARAHDGRENANVDVDTKWFGVKVAAAKFQSSDAPQNVLAFYRSEMASYGPVTECHGHVDFKGRTGDQRAVCRERPSSSDVQLLAGTEDRQRIVVVKPKDGGTEFSMVYVQTRGGN